MCHARELLMPEDGDGEDEFNMGIWTQVALALFKDRAK
jgi:hypothetical protein